MGPKPYIEFGVTINGETVSEKIEGKLLTCEEKPFTLFEDQDVHAISKYDKERGCYWTEYMWGNSLDCEDSVCIYNYFFSFPTDVRFAFYVADDDEPYISETFTVSSSRSRFDIDFTDKQNSSIEEGRLPITVAFIITFILAVIFTVISELVIALLFAVIMKLKSKLKLLVTVVIVNFVTISLLWLTAQIFSFGTNLVFLLVGELLVFVIEGLAIFMVNKNQLSFMKAFILSFVMNIITGVMTFCSLYVAAYSL